MQFTYANNSLSFTSEGSYHASQPLANITIAGLKEEPHSISMRYGSHECNSSQIITGYSAGVLRLANTAQFTPDGAFQEDLKLELKY
jgi:alpha-glucosidase